MFKNKYVLVVVLLLIAGLQALQLQRGPERRSTTLDTSVESHDRSRATSNAVSEAFADRRSNVQVAGEGVVEKLLPDDTKGSRHQRFVLRIADGQTLLIAHNIDLAPRIEGLRVGDVVRFFGEYEWNDQGGVLHWTHHDPQGQHVGGWLEHRSRRYQ